MTDLLTLHAKKISTVKLIDLFKADPARFERFSAKACGIFMDYSKTHVTEETRSLLIARLNERGFDRGRKAMFSGEKINVTEGRPVLHTACRNRGSAPVNVDGRDVMPEINAVLQQMRAFVDKIHTAGKIKHIVNIGIGGSSLGPEMVCQALQPFARSGISSHFVSNVDHAHIACVLSGLDPAQTLFVIASKTFTTPETMLNAHSAKEWFQARGGTDIAAHFVALSTNTGAAADFGIHPDNVFRFWDWVGGRFSVWSAIGLSIALAIGMQQFEAFLDGAHDMDMHFRDSPPERNLPVLLALIGIWYRNFKGAPAYGVIPYCQHLRRFPAWLQQVDMESNGKSVTSNGQVVAGSTGPLVFGEPGTDAQHSFFQLIHQGTDIIPLDFIGVRTPSDGNKGDLHHTRLMANYLAQMEALMTGMPHAEAARAFAGNRPTTALLLDELTPRTLGSLMAMYEHKIFVQGLIWGINSFDQFGVELGKVLARKIEQELLHGEIGAHDGSTAGLIGQLSSRS